MKIDFCLLVRQYSEYAQYVKACILAGNVSLILQYISARILYSRPYVVSRC